MTETLDMRIRRQRVNESRQRERRIGVRALALLGSVLVLVLFGGVNGASAHAALTGTDPQEGSVLKSAPRQVTLTFSESIGLFDDSFRVLDPENRRVRTGEPEHADGRADTVGVTLPRGLGTGTYTVAWRVVSADSHPVSGAFTFSVGKPSATRAPLPPTAGDPASSALYDIARYAAYTGLALLIGAVTFVLVCGFPGSVRRLLVTGWWILLGSTLALLLLRGPYERGTGLSGVFNPESLSDTLAGRPGIVLVARLALLAAVAFVPPRVPVRGRGWPWRPRARCAVLPGPGGHLGRRRARLRRDPGPRGDGLLRAASARHGGVARGSGRPAGRAPPSRRAGPPGRRHPVLPARPHLGRGPRGHRRLPVLARPRLLGRPDLDLVRQAPGRESRPGGAAPGGSRVLATLDDPRGDGADPRRLSRPSRVAVPVTVPASEGPAPEGPASDGPAGDEAAGDGAKGGQGDTEYHRGLRRSVLAEVTIGILVLVITTMLTGTQPGRAATESADAVAAVRRVTSRTTLVPFDVGTPGGHGKVQIELTPGQVGENSVQVVVFGPDGGLVTVPEVRLTFTQESQKVGPIDAEITDKGGYWTSDGLTLPLPGTWTMKVTVRTSDIDEITVSKKVTID